VAVFVALEYPAW